MNAAELVHIVKGCVREAAEAYPNVSTEDICELVAVEIARYVEEMVDRVEQRIAELETRHERQVSA